MDAEHPPFLRLWAALPVAFDKSLKLDTAVIDQISPPDWVGMGQFEYAQHYLYKENDADRLLYRERLMIVLLGILLGILLFSWTNEWLGFWPAVVVLVFAMMFLSGDPAVIYIGEDQFVQRLQSYIELAPTLRERVPDIDYVDLRFDERIYVRPAGKPGRARDVAQASGGIKSKRR